MECRSGVLDSSTQSARLEQEAHALSLRQRTLAASAIGSPQYRQIREFTAMSEPGKFPDHPPPVPAPMVIADGAQRMKNHASDSVVGDHSAHTDYRGTKERRSREFKDQPPYVIFLKSRYLSTRRAA